jgi:hypothetical protein
MVSVSDESFCAVKWENSSTISTVSQSAIFKSPEFTHVNDVCFVETEQEYSGRSRFFVNGGASMGMGAIESKKRVMGSFLNLFCCGKKKIFFRKGGDRPQCAPLNPPLQEYRKGQIIFIG